MGNCDRCTKPDALCVCDRLPVLSTRTKLLVLMHPREKDEPLSTVPLLRAALPNATVRIGLSWANLSAALEREVENKSWAIIFPDADHAASTREVQVIDRKGTPIESPALEGIVVLDGSWKEAKSLWWRNAWLLRHPRVSLSPKQPSIYGKMRKEPRKEWVSTLEAVALSFDGLGEDPEVGNTLRRALRTLVQRARDAQTR